MYFKYHAAGHAVFGGLAHFAWFLHEPFMYYLKCDFWEPQYGVDLVPKIVVKN